MNKVIPDVLYINVLRIRGLFLVINGEFKITSL